MVYIKKTTALLAMAAAALGVITTPANASPEQAAGLPCLHPGWGTIYSDVGLTTNNVPILAGVGRSCPENGRGQRGDSLTQWCRMHYDGIDWVFVTDWTRNVRGWVSYGWTDRANNTACPPGVA